MAVGVLDQLRPLCWRQRPPAAVRAVGDASQRGRRLRSRAFLRDGTADRCGVWTMISQCHCSPRHTAQHGGNRAAMDGSQRCFLDRSRAPSFVPCGRRRPEHVFARLVVINPALFGHDDDRLHGLDLHQRLALTR